MKYIFRSNESARTDQVGGKGFQLQNLIGWKANVAPFFVIGTDACDEYLRTGQINSKVSKAVESFISQHGKVALRSSMIGEDHLDASFAGLFETILGVDQESWKDALIKIYESMSLPRVKNYLIQKNIQSELKMAVVVQKEIRVEKSGVLFTRAPMPPTSLVAIDAGMGMGEGVVSGHVEVDNYLFTRLGELVEGDKNNILTESEQRILLKESLRLERVFGKPADIEWGILKDELFIFQIRPITRTFAPLKVFADTNLTESYPGAVSPFTAEFVKKAYENVFLEAAHLLGIQGERLEVLKPHCARLISALDDHLYYNLEHYYAVLRALPGGDKNIENWHKMIGGKVDGIEVPFHDTFVSRVGLVNSIYNLGRLAFRKKQIYPRLISELNSLSQLITSDMQHLRTSTEVIQYLGNLTERPLSFGLTIINDFFIMIGLGILSSSIKKKGLPEDAVIDLLKTSGSVDSIKPLQAFNQLVQSLSQDFITAFNLIDVSEGFEPYKEAFIELENKGWRSEVSLVKKFLDEYGDRSFEELKLESLPLRNDPSLFKKLISWGKGHDTSVTKHRPEVSQISLNFFETRVLNFTRECIEFRETTRLWRGRFYHFLRQLVLNLASRLMQEDSRWKKFSLKDFFSINHYEWKKVAEKKLTFEDIEKHISERDWRVRQQVYPEFAYWSETEKLPQFDQKFSSSDPMRGQGVSPGIVEARALVLESPTEILGEQLGEFILVTKNTDPAWVYIMSRSQGLVSEKGSMLSHTAIIGRELGIPTLVGVKNATHIIKTGDLIRIDGSNGEIKIV